MWCRTKAKSTTCWQAWGFEPDDAQRRLWYLMQRFPGAARQLRDLQGTKPQDQAAVERAMRHLNTVAKALQLQDMF